mmetsp:Transcript_126797/g.355083  ORF Transcript_126797/g.355083 Transcript_126797/m.355083 type:complete len:215 (-) Transcript_126797:331-975(-)
MSSWTSPAQSQATSFRRVTNRRGRPRRRLENVTSEPYWACINASASRRSSSGSERSSRSNSSSLALCLATCSLARFASCSCSMRSCSSRTALSAASRSACSAASRATSSRRCSSSSTLAAFSASSRSRLRSISRTFSMGFQPCGRTSKATGLDFKQPMTTSWFCGTKAWPLTACTSQFAGMPFFCAREPSITARINGGKPPDIRRPNGPDSSAS